MADRGNHPTATWSTGRYPYNTRRDDWNADDREGYAWVLQNEQIYQARLHYYSQLYGNARGHAIARRMATPQPQLMQAPERYVIIHVATTCDEHGVYVTKDSAEVIEIGWILVDGKTLEEVR